MFGNNDDDQNQQANDAVTFPPVPVAGQDVTQSAPPIDDDHDLGITPVTSNTPTADEPAAMPAPADDNLLNIKQQALQQLTPLVGHLDQSPDEKFRTIMMMIQASDDHTKLTEAFETAKQITDDKARAQALLDIINEINYFTQQHQG